MELIVMREDLLADDVEQPVTLLTGVPTITTVTCCPVRGDGSLSRADSSALSEVWITWFCS